MTDEEEMKLLENIRLAREAVSSHRDLAKFVELMLYANKNGFFEAQDVDDYLGGLVGLLDGLDGWSKNVWKMEAAPDQPDWRWMARLLYAAFYHS